LKLTFEKIIEIFDRGQHIRTLDSISHTNDHANHSIRKQIRMTDKETKANAALTKIENELMSLKDELKVHKEAKTVSAACGDIAEFSQRGEEPFSSSSNEQNSWHKSEGGGCVIL